MLIVLKGRSFGVGRLLELRVGVGWSARLPRISMGRFGGQV